MSKPRDAPTFFVDRDLGPHFYTRLATDGRFGVEFHDNHFGDPATDDSVWLQLISKNGWIGITHDKKIRRDHRAVIAAYGARLVIVVGTRQIAEQAMNFITTYPRIERFVRHRSGPYAAKLYHPAPAELKKLNPKGRIELWGEW